MIRYYLFLFLLIFCCLKNYSQTDHLVLDSYTLGVNNIYAKKSITLRPGFTIPLGSTARVFISSFPELICVPTKDRNYVLSRVFRDTVRFSGLHSARTVGEEQQNVRYFDGLGNPIQTVQVMASPSYRDIVEISKYGCCL